MSMQETIDEEEKLDAEWKHGEYVHEACQNCGRFRVCVCPNGKHRCEKCNWSPELQDYCPTDY